MVPEAVGSLRRGGDETVPWTIRAAGVGLQPLETERADIRRHPVRPWIAAGRHHEIDGAAERVGAELQGVGALPDFDIFIGGRIDLLKIAVAIGGVHRNAVHVKLYAAQMEIARQTGTPDRQPRVVTPFRLGKDAGHVIKNILDGIGDGRIPVRLGRHDSDTTRRVVDLRQRLLRAEHRQRAANALSLIAGDLRRACGIARLPGGTRGLRRIA
jgi:hypothetical protein